MFAGLADSTLSRDDGYRFMVLGRAIERVDMIVRLLLSRVGDSASSPAWVTVLRSAGAHDTYLRTYRGVLDAGRVVEFMMLDRLFPRSVMYSLRLAEHSLDELHHRRLNRVGATAEAQRLLGRARSELEFLRPGVLLESLEERLGALQDDLRRRRRGVGAGVLPLRAVGGVDRRGSQRFAGDRRRVRSEHVAHASHPRHRLRLQVAGDRVVQRGPADAAVGLPAERHPQPGRDRARHPVLPLRRLLGNGRDGVRPARSAHRARGDGVVGGRDRQGRGARGEAHAGRTWSRAAVIDRFDEYLTATEYTPASRRLDAGRCSASPSTTTRRRR